VCIEYLHYHILPKIDRLELVCMYAYPIGKTVQYNCAEGILPDQTIIKTYVPGSSYSMKLVPDNYCIVAG
jgi:hypothetical protein